MDTFSEPGLFTDLGVFVAVFAAGLGLGFWPATLRGLDRAACALSAFVRRRGLFATEAAPTEQWRLDLLRIVLGSMACWRTALNLLALRAADDPMAHGAASAAFLLAVMVTVGLATPLSAAALAVLINLVLDRLTSSSTLGSMVLSIPLVLVAFLPGGRRLSLDALLMARPGRLGPAVGRAYTWWGRFSLTRADAVKFCALTAYAALNLDSVLRHLREEAWTSGLTNAWLFLLPTSNPNYFAIADRIYGTSPFAYVVLAKASVYGQMGWELLLVPLLLLGRWPRRLAIAWGLAFFLFSALVLPLSMLGWYELVLWAMLFGDRAPAHRFLSLKTSFRGEAPPRGSEARGEGAMSPMLGAYVWSFALLLGCHTVRLPFAGQLPLVRNASAALDWLGRAPLAYGLGPVGVFNREDLQVLRFVPRYESAQITEFAPRPHLTLPIVPDSIAYGYEAAMKRLARTKDLCGNRLAAALERYASFGPGHGTRDEAGTNWELFLLRVPSAKDLNRYHYRPVTWHRLCHIHARDGVNGTVTTTFQDGLDVLLEPWKPMPRLNATRMDLVRRFPCTVEAERIAHWLENPILWTQGSREVAAVRSLLNEPRQAETLPCLRRLLGVTQGLGLDWQSAIVLPAEGSCAADLRLARRYYNKVFDEELRARTTDALQRATRADAEGDLKACLLATGELRRSYLDAVLLGPGVACQGENGDRRAPQPLPGH